MIQIYSWARQRADKEKKSKQYFCTFYNKGSFNVLPSNNATSSMQCKTHKHTHTKLPHCACQKHNNCLSMFGQKTHTMCSHLIVGKTLKNHLSTLARKKNPHPMLLAEKLQRELLAKLPSLHKLVLQPLFETTSSSCTRTRSSKSPHKSNSVPN